MRYLFSLSSSVFYYIRECSVFSKTELDGGVVELTSYIEDSDNATPPVSHCDHNKINAAAVTKLSIFHPSEIRYILYLASNL